MKKRNKAVLSTENNDEGEKLTNGTENQRGNDFGQGYAENSVALNPLFHCLQSYGQVGFFVFILLNAITLGSRSSQNRHTVKPKRSSTGISLEKY